MKITLIVMVVPIQTTMTVVTFLVEKPGIVSALVYYFCFSQFELSKFISTVGVAKLLLDYGANINTHSNEFKESALTLACYKGHLEMVKFLLNSGESKSFSSWPIQVILQINSGVHFVLLEKFVRRQECGSLLLLFLLFCFWFLVFHFWRLILLEFALFAGFSVVFACCIVFGCFALI